MPDGTKPLPEPLLTKHQWSIVAFSWREISLVILKILILDTSLKMTNLILQPHHPGANELNLAWLGVGLLNLLLLIFVMIPTLGWLCQWSKHTWMIWLNKSYESQWADDITRTKPYTFYGMYYTCQCLALIQWSCHILKWKDQHFDKRFVTGYTGNHHVIILTIFCHSVDLVILISSGAVRKIMSKWWHFRISVACSNMIQYCMWYVIIQNNCETKYYTNGEGVMYSRLWINQDKPHISLSQMSSVWAISRKLCYNETKDTTKFSGLLTFPYKKWLRQVKHNCITMFDTYRIKHKSMFKH